MPNVTFVTPELRNLLPQYREISDCIAGQTVIKANTTRYLPKPNAADTSKENDERYKAYVSRAVFYNVTRRTMRGLLGQVFSRDPEIELPSEIATLEDDATGGGVSLTQLAKQATAGVIAYGRGGIHVDFPDTPEGVSVGQVRSGLIRPTLNYYKPSEIINWRVTTIGARDVLTLVVLEEKYVKKDDGFEFQYGKRYRVLRLTNGVYTVQIYTDGATAPDNSFTPTDASGNTFDEIPFTFIGVDNNDPEPDNPPLYDLASLNIAHYRNSADYEESCFMVGQPTPWFSGLTEDWVKDVLGGRVELGSRAAISLPVGAEAGLLQPEANTMPFEAMEHKERQMVALGAKLVEQREVQRTATEAKLEVSTENSTLASAAQNVSRAFVWALGMAGRFVTGTVSSGITFVLNTEFDLNNMSPEEQKQVVSDWQAGAISFTEMRNRFRLAGIAIQDDASAKEEIARDMPAAPEVDTAGEGIGDE